MTDIYEFQQETSQYSQYNEYINQQKEYLKNLMAQGGQTLGESTPLFLDTFKNVKNLFTTGKKLTGQLSTLKEDTEKAFQKSFEKVSNIAEDAATKLETHLEEGGKKALDVVSDVAQHAKETGEQLVKTTVRKSRLLKDKLSGLSEDTKDNLSTLQNRFTELKNKVNERISKGFDINTDPELQKLKAEGNEISSKVSNLLGVDETQTTKLLRTETINKHLETVRDMPKLEEAPKVAETTTETPKTVLSSKTSYFRNRFDRMLEKRTQSKFEQEFDKDPEDLDTRISFMTERDKLIEGAKKQYNPISKKVESTAKEAKTKAEDLTKQAKTKAEDLTEQAKSKISTEVEKVGHEIGEQKQQFEQVGKQMIEKGEQVAKEGVKAVGETSTELMSKGVEAGKSIISKTSEGVSNISKIGSEVAENVAKTSEEAATGIGEAIMEGLGPVGEVGATALLLYQGIKDIFSGSHSAPPPTAAAPAFTPNI